ncbi:hypothetical protein [Kamptonema formosum]|uniref:hypothetical protein n=1 Tax=Kamptonema formosum TaxID=331992 RepID=UPI0003483B98|nr:hypothetical protein [Oscillatoria sp. PCC 10802]
MDSVLECGGRDGEGLSAFQQGHPRWPANFKGSTRTLLTNLSRSYRSLDAGMFPACQSAGGHRQRAEKRPSTFGVGWASTGWLLLTATCLQSAFHQKSHRNDSSKSL